MTKTINLNKQQKATVEKAISTGKSFYQEVKGLFASDEVVRNLFLTRTVKQIAVEIYGEKVNTDPEFAITENRERTSLGNAIHNLKRLCKSLYVEKHLPTTIKKFENVLKDLSTLAENFSAYKPTEQDSILNQIEAMIMKINKNIPKAKAIKVK